MITKKFRVRPGCVLNCNGELKRGGDVVELTENQWTDTGIMGLIQPVDPPAKVPTPIPASPVTTPTTTATKKEE